MLADIAAVTSGSAHCGGKCEGWAKISPMKVAIALIVACRATLSMVRSLQEEKNGNHCAYAPANRGETHMLQAECAENVAARHHKKAGEPRACELFQRRARKPTRA
jgi:hypothetical protein